MADPDDPAPSAAMPEARPGPIGKPRRRLFSRSPNDSIIVEVADTSVRVGKASQRRFAGLLLGPVLKFAVGGIAAVVAALAAWRC